jgi:nitrite reductase/ring-hydroxylating ferredoxin subunit
MSHTLPDRALRRPRRHLGQPIPAEGEGGLFTQSWYPICASSELPAGGVLGTDFLDGRVVAFRGESGVAQVLSAYCPHLGADLALGTVVGETLRCPFHHFRFDRSGACVATGTGDPPPRAACLFRFPTTERHGLVWAFNGEAPSYDLPSFAVADEDLARKIAVYDDLVGVDPWVVCCNTPDIQHIQLLHRVTLTEGDPTDQIDWTSHSMMYDLRGKNHRGDLIDLRIGVIGTSIYYQSGFVQGRWFGYLSALGLPAPGKTRIFQAIVARRADGDDAENEAFLVSMLALQREIFAEDLPIMQTMRYRPGTLTRSDRALARYFDFLRAYPRAHPSAEFIR